MLDSSYVTNFKIPFRNENVYVRTYAYIIVHKIMYKIFKRMVSLLLLAE